MIWLEAVIHIHSSIYTYLFTCCFFTSTIFAFLHFSAPTMAANGFLLLFATYLLGSASWVSAHQDEELHMKIALLPPSLPVSPVPVKPPTSPAPPVTEPPTFMPPTRAPPLIRPPTTPVKPPTVTPPAVKPPTTTPAPPVKAPMPAPPVQPPTTAPYPPMPPVKSIKDCFPLCTGRCKLHSRQRLCMRACTTCCDRCKCVPPGTHGNKEMCGKCYTDMTTRGNRPKCP